ncbi:MAG: fluoride efflux transporter CrcB [Flammeovirgaceae bacterium]
MLKLTDFFLVFLGGGLGSVLRFLLSRMIMTKYPTVFPWGTWWINFIGSFLIGLIFAYSSKSPHIQSYKLFLISGFCGGFTTFSTFSLDNWNLYTKGEYLYAIFYSTSSVILGIVAAMTGIFLVKN